MQKSIGLFLTATFTATLLLLVSCEKDHYVDNPYKIYYDANGLPTYSEIGKGSFGFLLNDTAWLPGCSKWLNPSGAALYIDRAQITANDNCSGPIGRQLQLSMPRFAEGTHTLNDQGFDAYYIDYDTYRRYYCSIRDTAFSKFEILHYDSVKHILSGKFQMKMYRPTVSQHLGQVSLSERDQFLDFSDSIVIKDGRFDVVHR